MTPEQIREAINAALSDKITLTWWQLGVAVLLMAAAAILGSYLRKKGENLATKEDLQALNRQVEAIKGEYAQQIEDYKSELARRTTAIEVAELLAEFIYSETMEKKAFAAKVWRLSLILPPDIVKQLSSTLVEYEQGRQNPKSLLINVRKLIHGDNDNLTQENIIHIR